jgi:hypothetical protein
MQAIILSQVVLPLLSMASIVVFYIFLIQKRQMKLRYLENPSKAIANTIVVDDKSEEFWWFLCMGMIFFSFLGAILFYFNMTEHISREIIMDVIFYGLGLWSVIAYVGYRITRSEESLFELVIQDLIGPFKGQGE